MLKCAVHTLVVGILLSGEDQAFGGEDGKKLVHQAATGFAAMISAIETMECKIERKHTKGGTTTVSSARYIRKGDREITRMKNQKGKDYIKAQTGNESYELSHIPQVKGPDELLGGIRRRETPFDEGLGLDTWSILGFRDHMWSMAAIIKQKEGDRYNLCNAKRLDVLGSDGHRGIQIWWESKTSGENPRTHSQTRDHDGEYNFLRVSESIESSGNKIGWSRKKVLRMVKEVEPGIFLPFEIEEVYKDGKGQQTSKTVWTLSDVKVNHKVPDEAVAFTFPKGTRVQDFIIGVEYKAGADGKPDGPVHELPKTVSPAEIKK